MSPESDSGSPSSVLRSLRELAKTRVVGEMRWLGLGQAVTLIAGFLGLRILTELVSPSTYAEAILLVGLARLGGDVFCYPILEATLRFFPDAVRDDRVGRFRRLVSGILMRRTVLATALLLGGGLLWILYSDAATSILAMVGAAMLLSFDAGRMYVLNLLNASRRQTSVALWSACNAIVRPAAAIGLILLFGPDSANIVLGYGIAAGALFLLSGKDGGKPPPGDREAEGEGWEANARHRIFRYATPLAPLAILGWIVTLSDRYLVAGLFDTAEAGIYAAAYAIGSTPFVAASGLLHLALRPLFNDAVARRNISRERKIFFGWLAILSAVLLSGLILMTLLAEPLTHVLLGEAFQRSAELIPWIGLAYVFQGFQQIFEDVIYAQQRTRSFLVIYLISSVTAVSLYVVLIPRFGGFGAAIGTCVSLFSSLAAAAVMSDALPRLLSRRSLGKPM